MRVAAAAKADAIHPGYGFLSESPEFADACAANGIVFIGPSPQTMRTLGNKVAARNLAISVGVPVMPATDPLPDDGEGARGKVGDGVNQAAGLISATVSIPSLNFIPLTTFGNWF